MTRGILNNVNCSVAGAPGQGSVVVGLALPTFDTPSTAGAVSGTTYSWALSEDGKAECFSGEAIFSGGVWTIQRDVTYNSTAGFGIKENFTSAATLQSEILAVDLEALVASLAPVARTGSYFDIPDAPPGFSGAYGDLTGAPALAPVATAGTYASLTGKPDLTVYQVLSGRNAVNGYAGLDGAGKIASALLALIAADIPNLDASKFASGTIDPARLPAAVFQAPQASSGGIADLNATQQGKIREGSTVVTTDGRWWTYSGTGSKTVEGSYYEGADKTPEWATIANKPANITTLAGLSALTAFGQSLLGLADAAALKTTLGLGALAYKGTVNLTSDVTGTLPVANGGTGVTTLAALKTALGIVDVVGSNTAQTRAGVDTATFLTPAALKNAAAGTYVTNPAQAWDTNTDGFFRVINANTSGQVPQPANLQDGTYFGLVKTNGYSVSFAGFFKLGTITVSGAYWDVFSATYSANVGYGVGNYTTGAS